MTLLPSSNTCLSQDVPSDQSETRADQFSAPSLLLDYLESVLFSSDDIQHYTSSHQSAGDDLILYGIDSKSVWLKFDVV